PLVVGIFDDEAQAKKALNELRNAGFSRDQISIAMPKEGLATHHISDDLLQGGIPQNEADYYEQAFKSGHTIAIVRVENRAQDALDILCKHGAHHVRTGLVSLGS